MIFHFGFFCAEGPMVVFSFERSGFGLLVTRVSIFETKLFTRRVKVLFLPPPPPPPLILTRSNEARIENTRLFVFYTYAVNPLLYGNGIEGNERILLMERCTRLGWESLLRTSP